MDQPAENPVTVVESGNGPYGQVVTVGGHTMAADEPEAHGGKDTGPTPYELVMAGLGACTAITMRMYAARHGWPLERIAVELHHDLIDAPDGAGKIDRFQREITLTGALTDEQRRRLLTIAEHCPVSRTLSRASTVVTQLRDAA
jgi:putative redox protein